MKRLLLLAPLLLAACVTWNPRSMRTSQTATVIPAMPMQRWGVESCGAGSLSTVLQHYGDHTTMAEWDGTLPKMRGGVLTLDMLLAARQKGFDARLVTGTPELVASELAQKHPVILMLQVVDYPGKHLDFFHYIVVDGIDPTRGLVRTQFGDGKPRWVTFDRIEKPWAGGGHAALVIQPHDALEDALRVAVSLEDQGHYNEAAVKYRDLLTAHPESVVAWTNLGNAELQLGSRPEAERAFRKALAVDPHSRDAMNNLAWLLFEDRQLVEAEDLARRAAAQHGPDSYLVLDTLAHILAAKGACEEAKTTFREAIDAVPNSRASARAGIEQGLQEATKSCG
ncbi:MAG: hypothetical protein JWN02_2639 [Acidobacteria bacterium]|nr:hypothetical protein [Acidobacteriota bacterium]